MTATVIEEPVLIPNRERLRQLREKRGWTIEEAYVQAKLLKLRGLSRQTFFNVESGDAGCRLSTMGSFMRLYGVRDLNALVEEVADPPKPSAAPPRRSR